jgi:hypothetical protein
MSGAIAKIGSDGGLAGVSFATGETDYSNSSRLAAAHGLAALRAAHLEAGNTAVMGCFGPAGRADARTRHPGSLAGYWSSPRAAGGSPASTTLASACSSASCFSWHGLLSSLIFTAGKAVLLSQALMVSSISLTTREPEFRLS